MISVHAFLGGKKAFCVYCCSYHDCSRTKKLSLSLGRLDDPFTSTFGSDLTSPALSSFSRVVKLPSPIGIRALGSIASISSTAFFCDSFVLDPASIIRMSMSPILLIVSLVGIVPSDPRWQHFTPSILKKKMMFSSFLASSFQVWKPTTGISLTSYSPGQSITCVGSSAVTSLPVLLSTTSALFISLSSSGFMRTVAFLPLNLKV